MLNEKGYYLAFEGIVGCGKTTQSKRLEAKLRSLYPQREVIWTKEPGGTEIADAIRKLVQGTPFDEEMTAKCEQYLYAASRAQSLPTVVKPVIDNAGIVVSDRPFFTSIAFQGFGRNLGPDLVWRINEPAVEDVIPNRVIFVDTPIDIALSRANDKLGDKFDSMGPDFFTKAREGYIYAVATYCSYVSLIDGLGTIEEVENRVWQVVQQDLGIAN